ncbi:MAG TPA: ATPase, T2SS/T4P/T4SS family [Patescibacteria group bacterium]|jgi:type IV pilus assembly protein PilB
MNEPAQSSPGSPAVTPQHFLDVLVNSGQLTVQAANQIRSEQLQTDRSYEELLLEKQLVTELAITKAKASFNNIPFTSISETSVSPEALNLVGESVAKRYQALPFAYDKTNRILKVAMSDPLDLSATNFLKQKTNLDLELYYTVPSELKRALNERYSQDISSEVTQALEQSDRSLSGVVQTQTTASKAEVVRDAPINRIVETILEFAIKARASDVHIEPQAGRTRVRYRIDGILTERLVLPSTVHDAVVSRIKILANLKIDERRVPQDGRFNYVAEAKDIDLRISTMPTIYGEKVVMRLLEKNTAVPSLEELGLGGLGLKYLQESIKIPRGIILVTGPTGSGKTTTLYSILHEINTPKVNIMTIEDPVEYQITGVSQVQVNPQAGLTFATGLRSFLRQDPDIIMVGEVRDTETAELAIQASLTGHLVFSTLHTSSAAGAIPRLLDMGAEAFLLSSTITLIMAQRIVRRINPAYVETYTPDPELVTDIKQVLGGWYTQWCQQNKKDPEKLVLYRPVGNRPAGEPDYLGRIGIFEVLPVTEEISHLIVKGANDAEIEKTAMSKGMLLMKQDGYMKALSGMTTIEEVLRVAEV